MQESFSLKMSYDDLSCFTPMSTIIIQRMFCQRSTLRVGNSCYIPALSYSDEAPQRCQWMPLCSVALSLLSLAKYLTMAFEKIHKSPKPTYSEYHLSGLSSLACHSSVHMAHSKSSNNLSPSCSFTHSASDHPSTPPPSRPHRPFLGPLAIVIRSIHGGARSEELLHDGGVAVVSRPVQRCPTSGAEGLGDVNGWRAPPRGSPPHTPTCSRRNSNLWSEVREFNLVQNCIPSWLNGSHYHCWCL